MSNPPERVRSTAEIGRSVGYSVQQVRDLERLGIIPPAVRAANGYRRYGARHETAARAYRQLAAAIGPVAARALMPMLIRSSVERAAERIDAVHADLADERSRLREALRGLEVAVSDADDVFDDADEMTVGELAQALGVRTSALRHWEREGLIRPMRDGRSARRYGSGAITEARVVAALRSGGYGIPAITRILEELRAHGESGGLQSILAARLDALTRRSVALLAAAGSLHALLADTERAGGADTATPAGAGGPGGEDPAARAPRLDV
ncbi:MerR family transcriptional regulator [Aneurinibacillus sp. BA2021]|nr:MerR family transcriptional regulator [Aneurinibacillus sp. BA2021]